MHSRNIYRVLAVSLLLITCSEDPTRSSNDNTPPPGADDYLAARQLGAAAAAYEDAVAANPNDMGAHFGAAFTGLMLLPEHAAVTRVLTQCGQPPVDVQGQVFGPAGYFSHVVADRAGTSALTLTSTPVGGGPTPLIFAPTGVYARVYDPDTTSTSISLWADDPANKLYVDFHMNPSELVWAPGRVYDLANNPWILYLDHRIDEDGIYYWFETVSGTVTVNQAGSHAGETIQLTFSNVRFDRWRDNMSTQAVDATYMLSGSLTDQVGVEFEPDHAKVPFMDLEDDPGPPFVPTHIQVLESCNPALSLPILLQAVNEVVGEVDRIRGHLDTIANAGDGFYWELPTGAVANTRPIPVGIAEVHLLRGLMHGVDAVNSVVQQYHWLDALFPSLISTFVEYTWDGSRQRHDFDLQLIAPQVNADFLRPLTTLDMTPVRTSVTAMLNAGKSALNASPAAGTLLNFQKIDARAASAELVDLADRLIASLSAPQADDSGNYTFHPSAFLNQPFDRDSMRAAVGGDLWLLTPRNAATSTNADLEPVQAFLDELVDTFLTIAAAPETDIFCADDAPCAAAAPVGAAWVCNGYSNGAGVCSGNMTTSCDPWVYPDPCAPGMCVDRTCGLAEPVLFDETVVDDAFDRDPPAFINEDVLDLLNDVF